MPTIGLTENRRQRHAWERDALADLRAGEVGRFLTAYQKHGRIHIGDTADQAKQQLISPNTIRLSARSATVEGCRVVATTSR